MKKLFLILLLSPLFATAQLCETFDTVRTNTATLITFNSARINGSVSHVAPGQIVTIILKYVRVGFTDTANVSSPTPLRNITGLAAGTQYTYYYSTVCPSGSVNQAGSYTFTTTSNTVAYAQERPTRFYYVTADTSLGIPAGDTTINRAPSTMPQIKYKTSNNTFYGYYPDCTCWRPLAIDSSGIIALLNNKVDSVTVDGDSLFYWKQGVGYGEVFPPTASVDSITRTPGVDSIYFWRSGNVYAILDSTGGGGGTTYTGNAPINVSGTVISADTSTANTGLVTLYQNGLKLNKADSTAGGYYPYSTNPKGYLTTHNNDSTTASNGLTLSGKDVKLGGTLTGSTTVNGNGNDLNLINGSGGNIYLTQTSLGSNLSQLSVESDVLYLSSGNVASNISNITLEPDSISILPPNGLITIDTLNRSSVATNTMMVWDSIGKRVAYQTIPTGGSGISGLTTNELVYGNSATTIASLPVATYPSLTELSYVKGVTSGIQAQLNAKAPIASPTFTGTVTIPTPFTLGATSVTSTGTQLNYLNAATGTTGTASTNLVYSTSPLFTTPRLASTSTTGYVWTATDGSGNGSFQAATGGGVTSVSGTTNRITSTGGTTPVIDISSTYDAAVSTKISDSIDANAVTIRNPATGDTLFVEEATNEFLIKSLVAGSNITLTPTDTTIVIASTGGSSGITVGTTTITSGTSGRMPYNNSGVYGETTGITATSTKATLPNPSINNITGTYTTTATAAGTTTLTVTSTYDQFFTGTTTQDCVLPDATTLTVGMGYHVVNNSTGIVTVKKNGGTTVKALAAGTEIFLQVTNIGSAAGTYQTSYSTDLAIGDATATSITYPAGGRVWATQGAYVDADFTLSAASGVQSAFPTAYDVFNAEATTTYRVRGRYIMNTGATTHTTAMAFALAGGASVTDFQYTTMLWSAAANTIATAQSSTHVSGVASKVLNATSTAVYTIIEFSGLLRMNAAGTITPQINFSANPTGTNLMKVGSYIEFEKMGSNTMTFFGNFN